MKRILVVHHPGNAFSNPTLQAFIHYALTHSIEIDIRCKASLAPKPELKNLTWLKYGKIFNLLKKYFLKKNCVQSVIWVVTFCEVLFVFKKKYDLIVGVDREGVVDAGHYSRHLKIPYVYFSFEIMFSDEIGLHRKKLEKLYSKKAKLWMVQDDVRAKCLVKENGLDLDKCFICPVASAGPGKCNQLRLRDTLGIDSNKKVAIMIGSLSEWSMSDDIIASIDHWPQDWVLIVHERYGRAQQILRDRIDARHLGLRIVCSNSNTSNLDDMGSILAGVEAGLAFYNPIYTTPYNGNNLKFLGLSSGKIATYLRYGVPIITNHIGQYTEIVNRFRLGAVVDHPRELSSVLQTWRRPDYSEACRKYFSDYLDSNLFMPSLLNRLSGIN